jgi:hypothetical protein
MGRMVVKMKMSTGTVLKKLEERSRNIIPYYRMLTTMRYMRYYLDKCSVLEFKRDCEEEVVIWETQALNLEEDLRSFGILNEMGGLTFTAAWYNVVTEYKKGDACKDELLGTYLALYLDSLINLIEWVEEIGEVLISKKIEKYE